MNLAPDRPPRRRDEARALFRNAILDAAEAVFAERGFHGARIQDIAERARIAVGTVYNHFADKDEVLSALLDDRTEGLARAASSAAAIDRGTLGAASGPRLEARRRAHARLRRASTAPSSRSPTSTASSPAPRRPSARRPPARVKRMETLPRRLPRDRRGGDRLGRPRAARRRRARPLPRRHDARLRPVVACRERKATCESKPR